MENKQGIEFFDSFAQGSTDVDVVRGKRQMDPSQRSGIGIMGDEALKDGKLKSVQCASLGNLMVMKQNDSE
jgi:hypothetical protein